MVAGEAHAHVQQRVGERADGGRVRDDAVPILARE